MCLVYESHACTPTAGAADEALTWLEPIDRGYSTADQPEVNGKLPAVMNGVE
jgi:hypothetical protein